MRSQELLLAQFDAYLKDQIRELRPSRTREAMEYALFGSGKRIRPLLLFRMLESCALPPEIGFAQAAAIEMIHTYSLIHDDLPAMDNDDFRRGRPSCHRQYGEDIAILAGDGLLTQAFLQALRSDASPKQKNRLVALLSEKAGADGMIYGQELDILSESADHSAHLLEEVEKYKTGCLIELPLCAASILAGREEDLPTMEKLGELIGIQFQIQDDLLEKTSTPQIMGKSLSDQKNEKATALSFYTLEEGQAKVDEYDQKIREQLATLHLKGQALEAMTQQLSNRSR